MEQYETCNQAFGLFMFILLVSFPVLLQCNAPTHTVAAIGEHGQDMMLTPCACAFDILAYML